MQKQGYTADKQHLIIANSYQTNTKCIEKNLLFFVRNEKHLSASKKIDTFANHWLLAFSPKTEVEIYIRNGANFLKIEKGMVIFIPPFSIVEWFIKDTKPFQWEAFISPMMMPENFPKNPIVTNFGLKDKPKNTSEIFDLIDSRIKTNKIKIIEQQAQKSVLGLRVKESIECHFHQHLSISYLTKKLNASRMSFSSSFKKAYGLTPIEYRHRLRIFEALRMINLGYSITQSLLESGFSNQGQFIRHFKRLLGTTPLTYRPK